MFKPKIKMYIFIILIILLIIYIFPCLKGYAKIGGVEYPFMPRLPGKVSPAFIKIAQESFAEGNQASVNNQYIGFRFLSHRKIQNIELGTHVSELFERIGTPNGELGYNGLYMSIYYRYGIGRYLVFRLDYGGVLKDDFPFEGRVVTGIYLYNKNECIEIIKE